LKTATLYLSIGPDIRLLPASLDYYLGLGVSRVLMSVHLRDEWADGFLEKINSTIAGYPATIAHIHREPGIDERLRYLAVTTKHCIEDDWIVIADIDEFHEFSMSLADAVTYCEDMGYDYISGYFLDRLGVDGELPELQGNLWDVFPLGAEATPLITGGDSRKVALARAGIDLVGGHHYAYAGRRCPVQECTATVHHFKWDAGVSERARHMYRVLAESGKDWCIESTRLLAHLSDNNGRVGVDNMLTKVHWPGYMRTQQVVKAGWDGLHEDPNFLMPRRAPMESVERCDGDNWRISLGTGAVRYLNSASAMIMELCDGSRTVMEITGLLKSAYPWQWHAIERQVQESLRKLTHEGLLLKR